MAREALSMDTLADTKLDETFMDWRNSDKDHNMNMGKLRITTGTGVGSFSFVLHRPLAGVSFDWNQFHSIH
jgi:hypothetical protein